ncbi:MAG: phosphomannose isomerase type II C-terminal cupin domain [Dermatophilaceae bacterium]
MRQTHVKDSFMIERPEAPVQHHREEYDLEGDRNPSLDVFTVHRPWGQFEQFVSNETVTVKIITVEPGHRLSLQRHMHRGEMWQVLDVPIDITVDERQWTAKPGETVWVPHGAIHRMGNSGTAAGRLLEVGFGYFDETDIERLEDDYARHDLAGTT